MTDKFTYGFNIKYRFSKHVDNITDGNIDFSDKGINIDVSGTKSNKMAHLYLRNSSASEAVKRLLWTLTHLVATLNDFANNSTDYMAIRLLTEAIRNTLMTTNSTGVGLKEWFKSDRTMSVVIFGSEENKLYVTLNRYLKNPK